MVPTIPEVLLRRPAVSARVGFQRSALYEMIRRGEFPPPVRIGRRAVAWPESQVQAWIEARKAQAEVAR